MENVPQFISIGFDDNAFEDGMQWALNLLKPKMNPAGHGNHCTFDSTPARVTFFINSHVGITTDALKTLHAQVYRDGHEAANHTDTHGEELKLNPDKAVWTKEMTTCTDYLVGLGIPRTTIVGFRTPFLAASEATFQAIADFKFKYDCSVEHFYGPNGYDWPYTLDNSQDKTHVFPGLKPDNAYPGLWELPVNELITGMYSGITGFDYNLWVSSKMTRQQALDVLKRSLEVRMKGGNAPANRAPMLIGGHTDLYSAVNADANNTAPTPFLERRAAIAEFIDYALSYDPAVRIVPYAEVMHWMQSPVGLDGTKGK